MKYPKPIPTMSEFPGFSKLEWWDMCKKVKPKLTWGEFEVLWDGFFEYRRRKELH